MTNNFIFPKPRDWNTFEDIVADVFSRKYNNYNFQRYGRGGQQQYGVDIAGVTAVGLIGVQCKHYPQGAVKPKEIRGEIELSDSFLPHLDQYVIATSADRDTRAHAFVLEQSK